MARLFPTTVINYHLLRLLVGVIAFALPMVVVILSSNPLSSISASYHTEARDAFVGMLCAVATFLFAYNGRYLLQATLSKVASVAAIFVAYFPTSCDECKADTISAVHLVSAAVLFLILSFFCFVPYRADIKDAGGKIARRYAIYTICGWLMLISMLSVVMFKIILSPEEMRAWRVMYYAEFVALEAFAVSWMVASRWSWLTPFYYKDETVRLFR